ncbi:hypothetical protein BDR22DRAFT_885464 [Usnea florida]
MRILGPAAFQAWLKLKGLIDATRNANMPVSYPETCGHDIYDPIQSLPDSKTSRSMNGSHYEGQAWLDVFAVFGLHANEPFLNLGRLPTTNLMPTQRILIARDLRLSNLIPTRIETLLLVPKSISWTESNAAADGDQDQCSHLCRNNATLFQPITNSNSLPGRARDPSPRSKLKGLIDAVRNTNMPRDHDSK